MMRWIFFSLLVTGCRNTEPEEYTPPRDTEETGTTDTQDDTNDTSTDDSGNPTDSRTPKVLTVMIDGWKPEVINTADTPTVDTLLDAAAYSLTARVEDTTISGSGQTSFLTGVHRDKHQVPDNAFSEPNNDEYPHHFTRIKEANPQISTASYTTWSPIPDNIVSHADINVFADYSSNGDALVVEQLLADLATEDTDVISLMLSDLDATGHSTGFDEDNATYINQMEDIDAQLGAILTAIDARTTRAEERWLIILSTDHAGTGYGHGDNIPTHRLVPLIIKSDQVAVGEIWPAPDAVDIVPTLFHHLDIDIDDSWNLDGRVQGTTATSPPEAALDTNLVFNGDAEYERGYTDFEPDAAVPGWDDEGYATVMVYDAPDGFPASTDPGPEDRGSNYFCGGGTSDDTQLSQTIDLSALSEEIAAGATYELSAYVGGYSSQNDASAVSVTFLNSSQSALHTQTIGPLLAADRDNMTGMFPLSETGTVPTTAAFATITIDAYQSSGLNDGYTDNVSLILTAN